MAKKKQTSRRPHTTIVPGSSKTQAAAIAVRSLEEGSGEAQPRSAPESVEANRLFYGDNIDVLRGRIQAESVDLCYIDPPFNSQRNYNQIYNNAGSEDVALTQAFIDTWRWDSHAESNHRDIIANEHGRYSPKLVDLMKGLYQVLSPGSLYAYLASMATRINEMHRCLRKTGSFYLHCDPTASHYLKLILDAVFVSQGGEFQNEIIWRRTGSHNKTRRYAPIHDVILFYTKSSDYTWNRPKRPYMQGHVDEHLERLPDGSYRTQYYGNVLTGSGVRNGESGSPWRGIDPTAKNRHWAVPGAVIADLEGEVDFTGLSQHEKLDRLFELGYITIKEGEAWPIYQRVVKSSDGQPLADIWAFQPYTSGTVFGTDEGVDEDVRWLGTRDQERLGYPTQKPEGLLRRIISSSSNPGDVVMDAYCGCGTTVTVAQEMGRKWIGIDITYQSIAVIIKRLEDDHGKDVVASIAIDGIPRDVAAARSLATKKDDRVRKEFEKWAVLTYSKNRAVINEKKGADGGIDGTAYFMTGKDSSEKIVFQVKSGRVGRGDVAKLNSDRQRESAALAVLITLEEPTKAMRNEALSVGSYNLSVMGTTIPIVQIVSIQDMLEAGHRMNVPMSHEVLKKSQGVSSGVKQKSLLP